MESYDVIVIGGGIAGTTAAAFLGSEGGKKVLVLEQCSQLGGRATSFRGEGIVDVKAHKKVLADAALTVISDRCEPPFEEMVEKKLLDGYVFESGARGSWRTNRGRVSKTMDWYNKASNFFGNTSFVGIGVDGDYTAKRKTGMLPPEWMTTEDFMESVKVGMGLLAIQSIEETKAYDNVTVKDWCTQITNNEKALEWHYNRDTFHTVVNDPALNTAGEDMRVSLVYREDPNVTHDFGAWGFAGAPGHRHLSDSLADAATQYGGTVLKNAKVKEVLIKDNAVEGVVAVVDGIEQTIKAPIVINTLPPHRVSTIIPVEKLDEEFQIAAERTTKASCITTYIGMNRSIVDFALKPFDKRAFMWCPIVAKAEEGFRGDVPWVGVDLGAVAPTRCPEGKNLIAGVSNVLDVEARDPKKVDLVVDGMLNFYDNAFPGWRSATEFIMVLVNYGALMWRLPEDPHPDVVCKNVKGLYFAGDAYGKDCSCGGIEGATQSALYCVEAITGVSIREKVLGKVMA